VSRTVFFKWHTCFREGTTSINDKEGTGRKKKVTPTLLALVANALENDKLLTVKPLETKFDVSYGTMQIILMRFLNEIVGKLIDHLSINTKYTRAVSQAS